MKKLLFLLLILLIGCASFQVSILDHTPTHTVENINTKIGVIDNEFELHRLLKTNFNSQYDFPQYTIKQPIEWHYNNRFPNFRVFNRYSWFNGHKLGYMDASEMWNSWLWGYPYNYGVGWSYNWNNYYRYNGGHRGRTNIPSWGNKTKPNSVHVTKKTNNIQTSKYRVINNRRVVNPSPNPTKIQIEINIRRQRSRSIYKPLLQPNNNPPIRGNSRRKN